MSKVPFQVIVATSEDPEYPASELNMHSPHTKGWQSTSFCSYPQTLILAIDFPVNLTQIQILSHQAKIASKVELFVGQGDSIDQASFARLGYFTLDPNERSNYQARELKSVYISTRGRFIQLRLHENYQNKFNTDNQVGIVAINLLGNASEAPQLTSSPHTHPSQSRGPGNVHDLSLDLNFDPQTAARIRQLAEAKQRAVESEDYTTAKRLKAAERELRALGSRLTQLDVAKQEAVEAEDYDQASSLKEEMDSLRGQIEDHLRDMNLDQLIPQQFRQQQQPPATHSHASHASHAMSPRQPIQQQQMTPPPQSQPYPPSPMQSAPVQQQDQQDPMETPLGGGQPQNAVFSPMPPQGDSYGNDEIRVGSGGNASLPPEFLEEEEEFKKEQERARQTARSSDHPLAGVEGLEELSEPEALPAKIEVSDIQPILDVFGDYLVRCLHSKQWQLREAFFKKGLLSLPSLSLRTDSEGICLAVVKGLGDKLAQVVIASIELLHALLEAQAATGASSSSLAPLLDPVVQALVGRMGDGMAKTRLAATDCLKGLCDSPLVGPPAVASHCSRALPKNQKSNWRLISARMEMLEGIAEKFGVGRASGLSVEAAMRFADGSGAFAHSNGEVRDRCKSLAVVLMLKAGKKNVEPFLQGLRPKQKEEYDEAFELAKAGGGGRGEEEERKESARQRPQRSAPSPQRQQQQQQARRQQRRQPEPEPEPEEEYEEEEEEEEEEDFTTCMFCGAQDASWKEQNLDMHYWRDCPMLQRCVGCNQIIEVASSTEHLLDECEKKDEFTLCDVTGLAISEAEMGAWERDPRRQEVPPDFAMCPLCFAKIPDTEEDWQQHLRRECRENPRIRQG